MCDLVVTVIDMSGVNTCPLERFTRLGVILNTLLMVVLQLLIITISLLQSMHMPLRQQVRGDGFPTHNHRRQLQYEAGGSLNPEAHAVKCKAYRRTHNLDSPFDKHGKQLLDTLRQKAYCVPQAGVFQSAALFVSRL